MTNTDGVLFWGTPKKARPQAEHNQTSFNDGPPGAYIPNMSDENRQRWKAKKIGGKHPRVEIRKTVMQGVQMLIIVSESGQGFPRNSEKPERNKGVNVSISMNGPAKMDFRDFYKMHLAVEEARAALRRE